MRSGAAVVVDLDVLRENLRRFHAAAAAAGVAVRAHTKAHRTRELPQLQVAAGAVGAATQTAHAARDLAAAGVTDVVVAWPWRDEWRWPLYAQAAREVPRFAVHIADADTVRGIGAAAAAAGTEVAVRIDVRHAPDDVPVLARVCAGTPGVRLDGVTSYSAPATEGEIADRHRVGRDDAQRLVALAEAVRADGIDCPTVSVGGTPTAAGALTVAGVTEVVAGAYATYDAGLAAAGVCDLGDVAISVAVDDAELLAGCTQPWAPDVVSVPAGGRLLPAHVCPLAKTLMDRAVDITVLAGGAETAAWRPSAKPDRR